MFFRVFNYYLAHLHRTSPSFHLTSRFMSSSSSIPSLTCFSTPNSTFPIHRILGHNPSPFTLNGTNCYLLGPSQAKFLIDTGEGRPEFLAELVQLLSSNSYQLDSIILTHYHHDHIGGVTDLLNSLPYSKNINIYKYLPDYFGFDYDETLIPWIKRVKLIQSQQCWKLDEKQQLRALLTPGHTKDSISLVLEPIENSSSSAIPRVLFSGDTILGSGSTSVFNDLQSYLSSLHSLLVIENLTTIYPAHGDLIDNPAKLINYYIQHRNNREQQIVECFHHCSLTAIQIVQAIYKGLAEELMSAAAGNVVLHLQKLQTEGKVKIADNEPIENQMQDLTDLSEEKIVQTIQKMANVKWELCRKTQ
jgi:ribonuclease/clavin/mitogillin